MKNIKLICLVILAFFLLNQGFGFAQDPKKLEEVKKKEAYEKQKQMQMELEQKAQMETILRQRITPEKEYELLEFIRERNSNEAEDLERLRNTNEMAYLKYLLALNYKTELEVVKESDPEKYERYKKMQFLEQEAKALAKTYQQKESDKDRKEIRKKLREILVDLFDYREQKREEEIVRLDEKLQELRKVLDERKKNKDAIVDRRLKELLGDMEHLAW